MHSVPRCLLAVPDPSFRSLPSSRWTQTSSGLPPSSEGHLPYPSKSHPEVDLLAQVAFVSDGTSNRLVLFSTSNLDELAVQGLAKIVRFVPSSGVIGKS